MGLALKKEDFDLVPEAPSLEFGRAMQQVETVNDFPKLVDEYQRGSLIWRTKLRTQFIEGLKKIEEKIAGADHAAVREHIFPELHRVFNALERAMKKFETPFHAREEVPERLKTIQAKNPKVARFLRKQIDRIEDIRVAQYNVCVELSFALLAFQAQYEDGQGEGETFTDPDDLVAFLKSQVA